MLRRSPTRRLASHALYTGALILCAGSTVLADAQQPAPLPSKPLAAAPQAPANFIIPASSTPSVTVPSTPAQRPSHRAEVTFSYGQLAVTADNASLNQILREIGRQTGISISGGVAEERVFGKYGPAATSDVLITLLEGTGSNVLLIPGEDGSKGQLILTPRHGGPTPPNPNAPGFDDDAGGDEDGVRRSRPVQGVSLYGNSPEIQNAPAVPGNGLPASAADPSNPNGANQQQSPNGVKSPQEIFQQLQQLRLQQQQQQQQTPPPQ